VKKAHLVVVPLTVLGNWMKEIAMWCPGLRAIRLHGTKEERKEILDVRGIYIYIYTHRHRKCFVYGHSRRDS